jgi:serine phosphatase RsbU (regulator of sigma subunit)
MTLQVCEAKSCWLEVIHGSEDRQAGRAVGAAATHADSFSVRVAAMKNITQEEVDEILPLGAPGLRDAVLANHESIVVDDVASDRRVAGGKHARRIAGSMVVVPLVSHSGMIGVLYATKDNTYGFVKDDVEVISAFADQATVAIENSRLIKKSIERERLLREMMLAQEMQRRLLPQSVPVLPMLDIDAISTPAFEVGGDYYDFMSLTPTTVGVIVGDVSGKGVSAAFYMSEVKGVFQSLGRMYASPREFMVRANDALSESIDKHSFVSLLYTTLDVERGTATIARAGHCPLLHCGRDGSTYIRPDGMGIGLAEGRPFVDSIEERVLTLQPGDVCILFTDGVTEARHGGDEFGYERLLAVAERVRDRSASMIKTEILEAVKTFIGHQAAHDDLTVVVVKWHGPPSGRSLTA